MRTRFIPDASLVIPALTPLHPGLFRHTPGLLVIPDALHVVVQTSTLRVEQYAQGVPSSLTGCGLGGGQSTYHLIHLAVVCRAAQEPRLDPFHVGIHLQSKSRRIGGSYFLAGCLPGAALSMCCVETSINSLSKKTFKYSIMGTLPVNIKHLYKMCTILDQRRRR